MSVYAQDWKIPPGNLYALNQNHIFPPDPDSQYHIPLLSPARILPDWLIPYKVRFRSERTSTKNTAVHFFTDDYRFETSVWIKPKYSLEALANYRIVCTPDFSLYRDWPIAMQIWNTYRNRWCGAFWERHGFAVIPTLSWSTAESYDFAFDGVPQNSAVIVSSIGISPKQPYQQHLFEAGFIEMNRRLNPAIILCYGKLPDYFGAFIAPETRLYVYPSEPWSGVRQGRKRTPQQIPHINRYPI